MNSFFWKKEGSLFCSWGLKVMFVYIICSSLGIDERQNNIKYLIEMPRTPLFDLIEYL